MKSSEADSYSKQKRKQHLPEKVGKNKRNAKEGKNYHLTVSVIPAESSGISNWSKLSAILGYKGKTSELPHKNLDAYSMTKESAEDIGNRSIPYKHNQSKHKVTTRDQKQHVNFPSQNKMGTNPTSQEKNKFQVLGYKGKTSQMPHKNLDACSTEKKSVENKNVPYTHKVATTDQKQHAKFSSQDKILTNPISQEKNKLTKIVSMDCEMVGTGSGGKDSMLARVSIVNRYGDCIYDTYVKPKENITDYRTKISGVRPADLIDGKDLFTVQKEILDIINGRILVGHALKHDFNVLYISHPKYMIRDTACYKPFRILFGGRTPSLKNLAAKFLGSKIQSGEHSSVEDAQATMQIYLMHKRYWEKSLKNKRRLKRKKMKDIVSLTST